MPVLNIGGRKVTVDESFLRLSPEEQNETVDEIAGSLGIVGAGNKAEEPAAAPTSFREAQRQSAAKDRGGLAASTTAGAQGWSWGASDEIAAGMFTPLEMAIGAITGEDADKGLLERARDAYSRGLELQRTQIKEARENHPGAALAGEVAGGAVTGGVGMGAAKSLAGRVAIGAGEGIAAGGVTGFMSGEGLEDRLEKAETGAKIGAGVGAAFPVVGAAVGAAVRGGKAVAEPFTEAGRDRIAARRIEEGATDADELRRSLDEGAEELVPGSEPTTFQATGDMGVGAMERVAQNRRPDLFMQRRADQNGARVSALEAIQPGGDPKAVAGALRQWQQAIDDETQAAVDAARGAGDAMRRSVDEESAAALDAARGSADAARRGVDEETGAALAGATRAAQDEAGALGAGATPDVAGDRLRGALEAARKRAKENERALWSAVDPDGTLTAPTEGLRAAAGRVVAEMPATAEPFAAKESALYDTINGLGETVSFRDMQGLRTRVNEALKAERREFGESAAYRRMTILRGALEDDLSGAIVQKVATEQQAVARGEMVAEDTLMARAQQWSDDWYARKAEAGNVLASGAGANAGGGSVAVSGPRGTTGQAGSRYGDAPRDPGLPTDAGGPAAPTFDPAARERLKAATDATRERAETFDNGTLGPMRARPSTTANYDMASSTVPSKVFFGGARSFDAIGVYRKAVGDDPAAMGAIRDYAVDRLLKVAGRPDGTIDPSKARTWRNVHKDALRAFPELDAQVLRAADASGAAGDAGRMRADALRDADRQSAATIRDAERERAGALREAGKPTEAETLAERSRTAALKEADYGTLGKLAKSEDPQEIANLVGGVIAAKDSAQQMLKLRNRIGQDEKGREGLKRAVIDHMTGRLVGNTEAATSGVGTMKSDGFQTFVRQNKSALRLAGFGDEDMEIMERIAADLQQANRSNAALKNPGGSDTAQNMLSVQGKDGPLTALGKVLAEQVADKSTRLVGAATGGTFAATTGDLIGGAAIAGAGIAAQVVSAMRAAKLSTVEDIVADALLNPERARLLLSKATGKGERDVMQRLLKSYTTAATVAGTLEATGERPVESAPVVPAPADRERPDSPRLTDDDRRSAIPRDLVDDGKQVLNGEREPMAPKTKLAEFEDRAKARRAARAAA